MTKSDERNHDTYEPVEEWLVSVMQDMQNRGYCKDCVLVDMAIFALSNLWCDKSIDLETGMLDLNTDELATIALFVSRKTMQIVREGGVSMQFVDDFQKPTMN